MINMEGDLEHMKEMTSSVDDAPVSESGEIFPQPQELHDSRDAPQGFRDADVSRVRREDSRQSTRFHPYTFSRPERRSQPPRDFSAERDFRGHEKLAKQLGKFWLHMSVGFEKSIAPEKQADFQQSMRVFLKKPMLWVYPNSNGSDPRNVIRILWSPLHDNIYETEVAMNEADADRIVKCKTRYLVQRACTYNSIDMKDVRVSCTVLKVL